MKKFRLLCLMMALVLALQLAPARVFAETEPTDETTPPVVAPNVQTEGDNSVINGCHSLNAQKPLQGNDRYLETAAAAMLYEVKSETVIYAWNPDATVYPASMVKLMTLLLAVENSELTDKVIVTDSALSALPKGTTHNLAAGEIWTMEQILYCMMVGGYNDASVVVAEHIAGSQHAFINMMNQRAEEIGCVGTHFTNSTGLHDEEQVTTTRDIVKILNEALKNEKFKPFIAATSYRLPASQFKDSRYMETPNYMMSANITQEYYDARVTGGRTGVTENRERCIAVTAESKGLYYIAIVMCAKQTLDDEGNITRFGSYEEARELLKMGFNNLQVTQILSDDQIITQYPVASGQNSVAVGPSETCFTVLPADILSGDLSYRYQQTPTLTAPVSSGEYITSVQVWYGDVCVAQSPIITKNGSLVATVTDQSIGIEKNSDSLRILLRLMAIVAVLVVLAGVVLVLIRMSRLAKLRAQHRRRRRNRRRSR